MPTFGCLSDDELAEKKRRERATMALISIMFRVYFNMPGRKRAQVMQLTKLYEECPTDETLDALYELFELGD